MEECVPDVHNSHLLGIWLAFVLKLDISGALFILLGIAFFSFLSSLLFFFSDVIDKFHLFFSLENHIQGFLKILYVLPPVWVLEDVPLA